MRGSAHQVTWWGRWLAPFIMALLGALVLALPAQAQVGGPQIEISPAAATIGVGDEATFDLFLNDAAASSVVAWEIHLQVSNGAILEFISEPGNAGQLAGEPVSETGGLATLVRLSETGEPVACHDSVDNDGDSEIDEADECVEEYFSAQNRLDATGNLDYTITLLRYDPADPEQRVEPFLGESHLHLGQLKVRGVAEGVAEIRVAAASSSGPVKVVELPTPGGELALVPLADQSGQTLASIEVAESVNFAGMVLPQLPLSPDPGNPAWFVVDLDVTFWTPGAVPVWMGGSDTPVLTANVTTNAAGEFLVTAPVADLPEGLYDVRVKERKTLSNAVAGVSVSGTPNSPPVDFGRLRDGDVNGDNLVDGADFSLFRLSFGKLDTDPGYNPNANFNRDNVVDGQDFSRLKPNFGVLGD